MHLPFHSHGVLGLNARNLLYMKPFNKKKAVAFADDKMKTKAFLGARGIPVAKLFARIDNRRQLAKFDFGVLPGDCVLKPNCGFGGEGIIILKGRRNGEFLEQGKHAISRRRLQEHIEDILDGKFSVSGLADTAFFENILVADDCFAPFRPAGLPDIRIIVFNLVPVMAMLRIPTPQSGGKANVHLGGIGIGIDIAKGVTTHAAQYNTILKELSHGQSVAGVAIPRWNELLLIASKIQYMTNIGFVAVDLTLDREMGPVLLEVNARAGLMVQVANLAPLRARLERVEGVSVGSPEKGVRLAQELFGEKVEVPHTKKPKEKLVLALQETISITGDGVSIEECCCVTPSRLETVFTEAFIRELLALKAIETMKGSVNKYRAKFTLGGRRIQTVITAGETNQAGIRAAIGQRDLGGFLLDPLKKSEKRFGAGVRKDLRAMDRILCGLDAELSLLKFLRPLNVNEERTRLRLDRHYQPVFHYRACDADLASIAETLKRLEPGDTPLGILLLAKRRELLFRLDLIRARGDSQKFQAASLALFGSPSSTLIGYAQDSLRQRSDVPERKTPARQRTAEEVRPDFEQILEKYGLHDWTVTVKRGMVADCAVGDRRMFIRSGALFTDDHVQALFAHEIETHALTAENGTMQPYEIFRRGCANYLDTQEGLAMFNQNRVLPAHHEKRTIAARSVLAVAFAMDHSFAETRQYLLQELKFSEEKAISKTIDIKRGFFATQDCGAFTKALVYFRGLRAIEHFVSLGGDLRRLYIGKIALEDLPLIDRIGGMRPPLILPEFLRPIPEEAPLQKRKTPRKKL